MKNYFCLFLFFISSSAFSMNDEQKAEMIANEIEFNEFLKSVYNQINDNDLTQPLEELAFCYIAIINNPENE